MAASLRYLSLICLSVLLTIPVFAQDVKTYDETFALDGRDRLSIDTYKGSIDVKTWDRDEIQIEAVVEADDDRDLVELTDVVFRKSARGISVKSDYERAKKKRKFFGIGGGSVSLPFVHYTIRMPHTIELNIEDYKSEIDIADVAADVRLETYKGEVRIEDITGDLDIETYKGDVVIHGLDGGLQAETYKGEIEAIFENMAAHSRIDTYRGEIRLMFPEDEQFDIDADLGKSGDLDSEFELSVVSRKDKKIRGTVNGGGPTLDIETYRGEIDLRVTNR